MKILGIETSCDETAAAVVRNGSEILSSVVSSQVKVHHPYGGVVPELASRKHIENIVPIVDQALRESGLAAEELDGVAVTRGPGLVGALLVGFSFAKGFAYTLELPWVGVNHLEGHIHSVFLGQDQPSFPFVALLVSGGHTSLYYVTSHTSYELMGQTRDDAVGEAYDKVAKMLDLGYPGGAVIDQLAAQGNPEKIVFPRPYIDKSAFDFSFSGLKTAVKRYIQTHEDYKSECPDIAAGFQAAAVEVLTYKLLNAAAMKKCGRIAVVGGVAANKELRANVTSRSVQKGLALHIPAIELCGDNAAMIAAVGYHYFLNHEKSDLGMDVFSRAR